MTEIDLLSRAHALFEGQAMRTAPDVLGPDTDRLTGATTGAMPRAYRDSLAGYRAALAGALRVDAELARILTGAHEERAEAHRDTGAVLAAARVDGAGADNPIAARELLRRRLIRLRIQRRHVLRARRRARRRRAALLALRYGPAGAARSGRTPHAETAVRAALSKLGRPYVWGAAGPERFDCSGLVKWAYGQAGTDLPRTTYDQINLGVPVARGQIRPGDLVFPHIGHVQMAIGNGLVVEAPYAGATVQISPLGPAIAIRRPL
jgi:cell wall-associated NlpC family hydrolase